LQVKAIPDSLTHDSLGANSKKAVVTEFPLVVMHSRLFIYSRLIHAYNIGGGSLQGHVLAFLSFLINQVLDAVAAALSCAGVASRQIAAVLLISLNQMLLLLQKHSLKYQLRHWLG
jgi:hypothetical protein